jgi:pyruvate formate lyase activating enzyme
MPTAKYWNMQDDGRIACTLCPRYCSIADGRRGMCFGRHRVGDVLIAETYGYACGLAVDPIEKKPIHHFLPGTQTLSFGTVGCNLTCKFCQNHHLSRCVQQHGTYASPHDIVDAAIRHRCQSVAFTYSEPTIFLEYAIETAKLCHQNALKTIAVTNGYINPAPREEFYSHIDAANVDLKAFTEDFYQDQCGASLQPVLDTLVYLRTETEVHLEVTTLLISGLNDSEEEIDAMTKWGMQNLGGDTPWHFSACHPTSCWHEAPPTPAETLYLAKDIAETNGLKHIHLGNI